MGSTKIGIRVDDSYQRGLWMKKTYKRAQGKLIEMF